MFKELVDFLGASHLINLSASVPPPPVPRIDPSLIIFPVNEEKDEDEEDDNGWDA